MKRGRCKTFVCWAAVALLAVAACAQSEMLPEEKPDQVFGGGLRRINVTLRNSGDQMSELSVRLRLYQTTCATAALLSEKLWKKVQVFPGQTVLETALVDFPEVRAETPFLIQWLAGANLVLAKTEVLVYPTNLLVELRALAGDSPLGVFDPANQLKPLLKPLDIPHQDLVEGGTDHFGGHLALFGPFESRAQIREGLGKQIKALATRGVAVVWMQPPPERRDKLQPSFYTVMVGNGAVVIVQASAVSNLRDDPQAQLNLIHCARLALHPEPIQLPHLTSQPSNQNRL